MGTTTWRLAAASGALTLLWLSAAAQEPNDSVVRAEPLVATERGDVVWSPRGGELAYTELTHVGPLSSESALVVVHLGTSTLERVTGAEQGASPAWSPDGARLAYIEIDPLAGAPSDVESPRGDLVISGLGGAAPRRLTRDGGYFAPRWVSQSPDAFVVQRDVLDERGEAIARRIHLITPDEPDRTRMSRVLAEWSLLPGVSGPRTVEVSPSGARAFYIGRATDGGRRVTLGLMDFRSGGEWCDGSPVVRDVEMPEGVQLLDHPRWSPDETKVALSSRVRGRGGWDVWILDVESGSLERRFGASDEGYYDAVEWADGGRALIGLYVRWDDAGALGGLAPLELRLAPLDPTHPAVVLEPQWQTQFPISRYWQIAPDATGTRFTVSGGGEIRVFGIGPATEAARFVSRENLRALGQALLTWTQMHTWPKEGIVGNYIPDPTDEGFRETYEDVDVKSDDFWVKLLREDLVATGRMTRESFEARLASPNDPQGFRRPSYYIPEAGYGLEVRPGRSVPRTPILRERSGVHPGGYHVLFSDLSCEWVEEPQP